MLISQLIDFDEYLGDINTLIEQLTDDGTDKFFEFSILELALMKYAGGKRAQMGNKLQVSRNFRLLIGNIKKHLKFNKFEDVFSDQDSDKKNFLTIDNFLDVLDVEIYVPEEQLEEKYFQEVIEDGYVSIKKLR